MERLFGDFHLRASSWKLINGAGFNALQTVSDRASVHNRFCPGTQGCAQIHNGLGVICSPLSGNKFSGYSPQLFVNAGFARPAFNCKVPGEHALYITIENYGGGYQACE